MLALFLTIVVVVKGAVIFRRGRALAWSVLAYVAIDFGFGNKLAGASDRPRLASTRRGRGDPRGDAAGVPVRLSQPQPLACALQPLAAFWLPFLLALVGLAAVNASDRRRRRAHFARDDCERSAFSSSCYLAHPPRYERAIALIPTWLMPLAWGRGPAGLVVTGQYSTNDLGRAAPCSAALSLVAVPIGLTSCSTPSSRGGSRGRRCPAIPERKRSP